MSKQTEQLFIFIIISICFFYPVFSEATELKDTKVLPITSNSYRKDPTELKKAVKKIITPSNSTSNNSTKSNAGFSKVKTTTATSPILSNTKSDSSSKSASSTSKTSASTSRTSISNSTDSDSSKNTTNNNSKSKVVAKSSITVPQSQNKKEEKTNSNTNKSKVVAQSSIKVSQPQKLKEEKTSRKDKIAEPILKVKLGGLHTNVAVILPDGGQINNSKGKKIKVLKKGETFSWTSIIDKNAKKKKKIDYLNETLNIKPAKNIFSFNKTEYRGKLYLKLTEKGATAVNEIPIEDYLRGVVGREIGANSPDESLKAQSVIARTYAYANKGRHGSDGADVCNTTHCQVYFGKNAERESVDKAIKNTRGYILSYNSNPISAL
ncbi:MAG: SpoIID/LytB domain-containing protein [Candidatus Riflebacteria bacterium]|nr:SpoIID/LytB domain-containing protein [Candidatus Riflebacteria bacterium]